MYVCIYIYIYIYLTPCQLSHTLKESEEETEGCGYRGSLPCNESVLRMCAIAGRLNAVCTMSAELLLRRLVQREKRASLSPVHKPLHCKFQDAI